MPGPDSLTQGEQLVLRLHAHPKTMVRPAFLLLLLVAAAIVVILLLPNSLGGIVRLVVGLVALLAALVWFGVPFLRWRMTTYEVTTRRLRLREGILSRSGRDFPLNRISDVSFSQDLLDRMFGCGRLIVESPGEMGRLVLSEIPDVRRVQAVLFQLVGDEEARLGRVGPSEDGT
ncbi:MAG TPA: PH domain-containing protein [Streptosporangiaceae bacterium]|nr:PH domain-containing protein [Streptosporangiaceae bacterium]